MTAGPEEQARTESKTLAQDAPTGTPVPDVLASVEKGAGGPPPLQAAMAAPSASAPQSSRRALLPRLAEPAFYILLITGALVARLWDLGPRAYHHDESLHAYYSWVLYTGDGFTHNPLMHGPLLFMVTALGFFLFGDNLAAPRVFPALFGTALVLMPLLLRDRLGKWGAMATATLIAVSPSIFYFSRFIREDIFTITFEAAVLVCVWRYMDTRKNRYLYLLALSLALLFSTKETSYITLAITVSFLLLWASLPLLRAMRARKGTSRVKRLRARGQPSRLSPQAVVAILMATLVLPLTSALIGFLVQELGGGGLVLVNDANNYAAGPVGSPIGGTQAFVIAAAIALSLFVVSAMIGLVWRKNVWALAFAVFWGTFFFLHTTAFSNMVGVGSGVWQGLGYWIAQQSVERGGQPWYYYLIMIPLYETLALAVSLVAVGSALTRLGRGLFGWAVLVLVAAGLIAASIYIVTGAKAFYAPLTIALVVVTWLALRKGGDPFEWFLIYWVAMALLLYTVAGEKMPWLTTHMALPLAFFAGRYLGRVLPEIEWARLLSSGGVAVLVMVPVLFLIIRALAMSAQWDRMPLGVWAFIGPLIAAGIISLTAIWAEARLGWRGLTQLAAASTMVVMGLFTLRTGFEAAFPHGDVPVEMLVYTQTSPQVADVMKRIDRIAFETNTGAELPILIDTTDGFAWPWHWYLRRYTRVSFQEMTGHSGPIASDVVVLNNSNRNAMSESAGAYTQGRTIPFRQWFPEESYRSYSAEKFLKDIISPKAWSRLLNFYTYRKLGEPLGHIDSVVYYSKFALEQAP